MPAQTWQALCEVWPRWQAIGHVLALDRAYAPMRLDGEDPVPAALAEACWQLWSPNKALGSTGVRAGVMVAPASWSAHEAAGWPDLWALAPSWVLSSEGVALLQAWCSPAVQAGLLGARASWRAALLAQQAQLLALGWTVRPSVVPFFLARPPEGVAVPALLSALRAHGIRLRDASSLGLPGWCRLRAMPEPAQQALQAGLNMALQTALPKIAQAEPLVRGPQDDDDHEKEVPPCVRAS